MCQIITVLHKHEQLLYVNLIKGPNNDSEITMKIYLNDKLHCTHPS
jgi:hypothetical protein